MFQGWRFIGREDFGIQRPAQKGVVDAVEQVAQRVVLAQYRLIHHLPGVAGAKDFDSDSGGFLEGVQHVFGDGEAVMRQQDQPVRLLGESGECHLKHQY